MRTNVGNYLEVNPPILQGSQESENRIVLGFFRFTCFDIDLFQFLMHHFPDEFPHIFLLPLAEERLTDSVRPMALGDGGQNAPGLSLGGILHVEPQVQPPKISHFRHTPTSGHKAVQSPWRSTSRHPAGKADTGRKRAGRGF